MAFKLGDIIIDRLQLGYGAKSSGTPLYVLTQLEEASISITAESTDITDKDGNLVYRKYTSKSGEVTATNAFMNLAVVEAISAIDAEIATEDSGIVMPQFKIVKAGETVELENLVDGTAVVSALSVKGSLGTTYTLGSAASATAYAISDGVLTPPTDEDETQYLVKYSKTVYSGAKLTVTADDYPTAHELYFKALMVDYCDDNALKPVIIHIPSFVISPDLTLNLVGGDSQTMDFSGTMLMDYCSTDRTLLEIYVIDDEEEEV